MGMAAEPGQLALRELAGAALYQVNRLREFPLAAQIFHNLPVTNGLHRGLVLGQALLQQLLCFHDQSSLKHAGHALIDACVHFRGLPPEHKKVPRRRIRHRRCPFGPLGGKRFSRQADNLNGPDNSARVLPVNRLVSHWIRRSQLLQEPADGGLDPLEHVKRAPDRFYLPQYLGRRGWFGLRLDVGEIDWDEVAALAQISYRLVSRKGLRSPQPEPGNNALTGRSLVRGSPSPVIHASQGPDASALLIDGNLLEAQARIVERLRPGEPRQAPVSAAAISGTIRGTSRPQIAARRKG